MDQIKKFRLYWFEHVRQIKRNNVFFLAFIQIAVFLLVLLPSSQAHPHLFITNYTSFQFQNDILQSITVTWRFDKMFSSSLIKDYDENRNKRFDKNEIVQLRNTAFVNLRKYGYFLRLTINKKVEPVQRVTNFTAWLKGSYVYYRFSIPIRENIPRNSGSVQLALFDPTYFTSITHAKNSVHINGLDQSSYHVAIRKSHNNRFAYGGMTITPRAVVLSRR